MQKINFIKSYALQMFHSCVSIFCSRLPTSDSKYFITRYAESNFDYKNNCLKVVIIH